MNQQPMNYVGYPAYEAMPFDQQTFRPMNMFSSSNMRKYLLPAVGLGLLAFVGYNVLGKKGKKKKR